MRISERQVGDVVVLDLVGPLYGWQAADDIEDAVRRHRRAGRRRLVVNLGRVHAVDCGGLGALVAVYKEMREAGGEVRLACLTRRISDLLVITRLLTVFETFDSVEQAIDAPISAPLVRNESIELSRMSLGTIQRFLRDAASPRHVA
jgi:anti-sigma B factor antagonist